MNPLPTFDSIALNDADVPAKWFWRCEESNHCRTGLRFYSLAVLAFSNNHFVQDGIEAARHAPAGIMALQFRQIRDVADVIALARLFRVGPINFPASQRFHPGNRFQDGDAVGAASAEVIDFAGPRIARKLFERAHHVKTMDIVADLFAFVAVHRVGAAGQRHLQHIGKETMQLDARMRGPGQASTAKNAHAHAEVFVDSFEIRRVGVVVARTGFAQRFLVGSVAVHFVGAHEDKRSLSAVLARGLEKIHCAERVDFKIEQRNVGRFVMRWLRGAMKDQVEAMLAKQSHDPFAVADIERGWSEALRYSLQALQIPQRISRWAEEHAAHVVVRADDVMALPVEIFDRFGANQAATSGHEDGPGLHCAAPPANDPSLTRPMPRPRYRTPFADSKCFRTRQQSITTRGEPLRPQSPAGMARNSGHGVVRTTTSLCAMHSSADAARWTLSPRMLAARAWP